MTDNPERSETWTERWRARRPTRAMRWVWGAIFLAGFGGWLWLVAEWAKHHRHADWVSDNPKPLYGIVAVATYWPVVIGLWHVLYPDDPRALPWDDQGE
jgi:hypothetical protein